MLDSNLMKIKEDVKELALERYDTTASTWKRPSNIYAMMKIDRAVSMILQNYKNKNFSDEDIITDAEKLKITDKRLIKRSLTMRTRNGVLVLVRTQSWTEYVDGYRQRGKNRYYKMIGNS